MSSPAPEGDNYLQSFSIFLTVYSKVKKTSMRGKMTSKEEKSTKMKELLFIAVESNYLEFLQAILLKHGMRVSDAIDVDNAVDYKEMVKNISEDKPPVVKIFVDMQHIKKLPQAIQSSDDSECTSDSSKGMSGSAKKANLDNRLARWRLKLQKAYKNEHDEGLTYIGPLGSIPLTPTMIRDWCLALEDGQATITTPPNIELFNMANKAPILHLMRKATAQPAPAALDLNSLTLAILLRTLAQFDTGLHSPTAPVMPMPQTPKQPKVEDTDGGLSPPIPSPSKLVHYLQFAESHLGVKHAMSYKSALEMHGIGPDILPDVSDKLLADLGLSAGDAIHLKKGSIAWWNGPDAKRKRSNASASGAPEPSSKRLNTQDSRPNRDSKLCRVSYERWYHEGGGWRFTAPPMHKDDNPGLPPKLDYDLFYLCETIKQWLPVPHGYSVDLDAEDNETE
ncbi:hypothetical protein PISMIDRAFT_17760 [Pisolithus microcarpus 441]|uniref:Uncharacterized protein n=1 Tax=Pisolithus microcarpus 441 TaxID=765257 RepID=A0A0C9Z1D8_9AGAM|nr:hypothetical protein PISMIDRAFT_17760 [Pisolithus microcarpus 441]